jgi:hypothetical protein
MEYSIHRLCDLFRQLGLRDDVAAIERFIATHRPLPNQIHVADAPFWTPSQARFLREEIAKDGDWAELVDILGALLSK